jgi:hypothetical protein
LILDNPVAQYQASIDSDCEMYAVGKVFHEFNYAIMFPPSMPDSDIEKLDIKIVTHFEKVR